MEHLALDQEPAVGDDRDVRVDRGVQVAVHLDVEPGDGEPVLVSDPLNSQIGELFGDRPVREDPQRGIVRLLSVT